MTGRTLSGLLALAVGPLGSCVAIGTILGADPMLAMEAAGIALIAIWVALVVRELIRSWRVSLVHAGDARETHLFGVRVRVTSSLEMDAVVVGAIRPVIYVGVDLLTTLSEDELRAVVLHEDHHRRTRAPLRAAALEAWLRLLGRSGRVRGAILERLADLEALADADAIRRGSTPRSLARALLKGEASLQPVSFGYSAERRVEDLLDRAAGVPVATARRLPYEWVPVVLVTMITLGCHVGL